MTFLLYGRTGFWCSFAYHARSSLMSNVISFFELVRHRPLLPICLFLFMSSLNFSTPFPLKRKSFPYFVTEIRDESTKIGVKTRLKNREKLLDLLKSKRHWFCCCFIPDADNSLSFHWRTWIFNKINVWFLYISSNKWDIIYTIHKYLFTTNKLFISTLILLKIHVLQWKDKLLSASGIFGS
jgi:hypothetical protein